jgi:hypothetical protein
MMTRLSILALTVALAACGKEAGRVPFAAEGAQNATMSLNKGEVSFWTDIDVEYQGDAALAYTVTLVQNGAPAAQVTCDPLGRLPVKSTWVETNVGASHSRRGNGKMSCSATLPNGGPTEVRATLAFAKKPQTFSLKRADLVVKQ